MEYAILQLGYDYDCYASLTREVIMCLIPGPHRVHQIEIDYVDDFLTTTEIIDVVNLNNQQVGTVIIEPSGQTYTEFRTNGPSYSIDK